MRGLLLVLLLALTSCAHNQLSAEESTTVRDRAREVALSSGVATSEEEIRLIKTTDPKVSYYFLAKPDAQYFITWETPGNEKIVVYGQGDIFTQQEAKVVRKQANGT